MQRGTYLRENVCSRREEDKKNATRRKRVTFISGERTRTKKKGEFGSKKRVLSLRKKIRGGGKKGDGSSLNSRGGCIEFGGLRGRVSFGRLEMRQGGRESALTSKETARRNVGATVNASKARRIPFSSGTLIRGGGEPIVAGKEQFSWDAKERVPPEEGRPWRKGPI